MADEARELLKRLVACEDDSECPWEFRAQAFADTRAFLAREQDGPVAEGYLRIYQSHDMWHVVGCCASDKGSEFRVRVPVPRTLYAREVIVGSVVENQEGK